ncbi:MAG: hypothetical protein JW838_10920 [Spirochaetes bacterium]|nr:hypothetical protein [Spirochaetota bacterium]
MNDVVVPSRHDLDGAIDDAVRIMTGDEAMNERVSSAIEEVLDLAHSIDTVLAFIDEIDIYSENMLIISSKYGDEGMSLARISNEVGSLAAAVNEVGGEFRELLGNLGVYREEFNEIRGRIEVISENYLTSMKLNLSLVFEKMVRELGSVSRNVNEMLERSEEIERSMKAFIVNIQMEDVIRQQIDRVILLLEGGTSGNQMEDDESFHEIAPTAVFVAIESLDELESTLSGQYDEVETQCGLLSSILEGMQSRFHGGDFAEVEREQNRMDTTYRRIEELKDEFIRHMEEIITGKKNLLVLCESFIVILNEFEGLFKAIGDTVKRFEALNMITRIELARHTRLSRTLGGALTSVMSLPAKMKRIIDESMDLYGRIRGNIVDAVERYAGNFRSQEEVLEGCIASMKKVSVKLYESQKYYWDISQEIGRYSERILGFIEDKCAQSGMDEGRKSLRRITEGVRAHFALIHGDLKPDIEGVWRRIRERPGMVPDGSFFAALGSEIETGKSRERVIIF